MGIVVLAIAILPGLTAHGGGLAERETSGHDYQKLLPRARDSAARPLVPVRRVSSRRRWPSDSSASPDRSAVQPVRRDHARHDDVSAGGFSPEARSFEAFGAAAQWVAIVFMSLVGVSFVLWYRTLFAATARCCATRSCGCTRAARHRRRVLAIILYGEGRTTARQRPARPVPVGVGDHCTASRRSTSPAGRASPSRCC